MKGVIYCFHCIPTGKKYIGQTVQEKQRKRQHKNLCKNGVDNKFYRAVRKYGWDNFIYGIIEEYEVKVLNEQETFYIDKYDTYHNGYNSTLGGEGVRGFIVSNDTKEKISNSLKGKNHPMFGKQQIEELKKIWSEIKKGKNNPMYGKVGKNSPSSKQYKITFENGDEIIICGLTQWAKENKYNRSHMFELCKEKCKRHKDIVKVEIL